MERFECASKLRIKPCLNDPVLGVKFCHRYHTPYKDILLTSDALKFVNERVATQTPSEIYQNLLSSGLSNVEHIVQYQVYYQWQQANKSYWRRDDDQITSATKLLEELSENYQYEIFRLRNVPPLGI